MTKQTTLASLAALVLSVFLAACGGRSPAGPTDSESLGASGIQNFRVLDGLTQRPVGSANVVIDGVTKVSAGDGTVSFTTDVNARPVDVTAAGYCLRSTTVAGDVTLWPTADGCNYESNVVYHQWSPGRSLIRPGIGTNFTVFVDQSFWNDSVSMDLIRRALSETQRLTGGRVTFSSPTLASATTVSVGQVLYRVDPNDPQINDSNAITKMKFNGSVVVGCDLVFRLATHSNSVLHELGHCMGFGHTTQNDIMGNHLADVEAVFSFDQHLIDTWSMMALRKPGQKFQDNDR